MAAPRHAGRVGSGRPCILMLRLERGVSWAPARSCPHSPSHPKLTDQTWVLAQKKALLSQEEATRSCPSLYLTSGAMMPRMWAVGEAEDEREKSCHLKSCIASQLRNQPSEAVLSIRTFVFTCCPSSGVLWLLPPFCTAHSWHGGTRSPSDTRLYLRSPRSGPLCTHLLKQLTRTSASGPGCLLTASHMRQALQGLQSSPY
ncbi:hypothetical protein JEQ12_000060 [Ovis aries]|uniref:Uncharacterized protein n=1 Tax=Ovis aries TaxID=9940 RepID=A0A836AKX9_SHEEP|nr:hypothetical protein JEQ12_000060 [Ovis aries]